MATFSDGSAILAAMPSPPVNTAAEPAPPPDRQGLREVVGALVRLIVGEANPRIFWVPFIATTVVVLMVVTLDAMMRLHLASYSNLDLPPWRAVTDEYSSGLVVILLFPVLARLAVLQTPWRRPGRFLIVHGLGALGFAVIHVTLFVLVRTMVYGLFGEVYDGGRLGGFPYEAPRDLITYAVCVGGVWGAMVLFQAPAASSTSPPRALFDIRDNARILRVPIDDILAVRSAGNYVEFLLADGRRPLMRATLAETADQLTPHGLARTHRSWLVNKGRIAQIEPAGSGDFKLTLAEGVEAPLSRRFKGAIDEG